MKFLFLIAFFLSINIEAICYLQSGQYNCYDDERLYYSGSMKESNRENARDATYFPKSAGGGVWDYLSLTGYGTYYYSKEDKYTGSFIDGKRDGYGVYEFKDGEKFQGIYKNSKRRGRGTLYDKDERVVYTGNWKNDKYHGQGTRYYYGNTWASVTGKYISGETYGIMEVFYQPESKIRYKKGEIYCCNDSYFSWHGKVETTYKNGAKLEEFYSEGKRTKANWLTTNEEANKKILDNQKLEKIRKDQLALEQKEREKKIKREEDIYNQCILDKVPSAKTDAAAELIKISCREISKNPTRWQIIKYLGYEGLKEILN